MYTAYFIINYAYGNFRHSVYIQKTIKDGERYHPLEDYTALEYADERVQLELNEYYSGECEREAQSCDIEVYLISAREYNDACNLFLKIVA